MLPLTILLMAAAGDPEPRDTSPTPAKYAYELDAIRSVGKEGAGGGEAAKAWARLVAAGPEALLPTLKAFQKASPAAQNWLRTAAGAIGEAGKGKLDVAALAGFLKDVKQHPAARRIAFELLKEADAKAADAVLLEFTHDPSVELRRDAIAAHLTTAEGVPALTKLFDAARDKDQVEGIAKSLKDLGASTDVTRHFGYVTQWHATGPFDNKAEKGYAVAYAPEAKIDLAAGADGKPWTPAQSSATYGTVDLNAALGKKKDAIAYAVATVVVEADTKCELRVASQNAVKFFVNGAEVFAREEYHHGTVMDQHTVGVTLKKGANTILLKVCQNDMPYSWAQAWGFAARLCDATGGPVPVKQQWDGKPVDTGALAQAPAAEKKDAK